MSIGSTVGATAAGAISTVRAITAVAGAGCSGMAMAACSAAATEAGLAILPFPANGKGVFSSQCRKHNTVGQRTGTVFVTAGTRHPSAGIGH